MRAAGQFDLRACQRDRAWETLFSLRQRAAGLFERGLGFVGVVAGVGPLKVDADEQAEFGLVERRGFGGVQPGGESLASVRKFARRRQRGDMTRLHLLGVVDAGSGGEQRGVEREGVVPAFARGEGDPSVGPARRNCGVPGRGPWRWRRARRRCRRDDPGRRRGASNWRRWRFFGEAVTMPASTPRASSRRPNPARYDAQRFAQVDEFGGERGFRGRIGPELRRSDGGRRGGRRGCLLPRRRGYRRARGAPRRRARPAATWPCRRRMRRAGWR